MPLYKKIIDDAIENTQVIGCFIAGTLVKIKPIDDPNDIWNTTYSKPIEQLQIGDLVLSRPEDGTETQEYKPVVNTFYFKQKPIWVVKFSELVEDIVFSRKTITSI